MKLYFKAIWHWLGLPAFTPATHFTNSSLLYSRAGLVTVYYHRWQVLNTRYSVPSVVPTVLGVVKILFLLVIDLSQRLCLALLSTVEQLFSTKFLLLKWVDWVLKYFQNGIKLFSSKPMPPVMWKHLLILKKASINFIDF